MKQTRACVRTSFVAVEICFFFLRWHVEVCVGAPMWVCYVRLLACVTFVLPRCAGEVGEVPPNPPSTWGWWDRTPSTHSAEEGGAVPPTPSTRGVCGSPTQSAQGVWGGPTIYWECAVDCAAALPPPACIDCVPLVLRRISFNSDSIFFLGSLKKKNPCGSWLWSQVQDQSRGHEDHFCSACLCGSACHRFRRCDARPVPCQL